MVVAFFIIGYELSMARPAGFGSLALAAYRCHDLVYVGNVGTGFKEAEAVKLRKTLDKLAWKRKRPAVDYEGESAIVWVQPTLIAEIEFRAWTTEGKLRRAAYKGLRERQDHADVFKMDSRSTAIALGELAKAKSLGRRTCAEPMATLGTEEMQ